jgi:hypothetical protein
MPQGTVQSVMATLPSGLVALLGRLTTVRYEWQLDHDGYDVIEWLKTIPVPLSEATALTSRNAETGRHAVLLDIDYPAYVVPSSTGGHNHVYLDVPDGLSDRQHRRLMKALAKAGVVEKEWAHANRHGTALRPPWVTKDAS